MPLDIKIDVVSEGKVALWHRRDLSPGKSEDWSDTILGNSPREVLLKFADTLQRRPKLEASE
jgi:hypothetical protein